MRDVFACIMRHQAFALPPVSGRVCVTGSEAANGIAGCQREGDEAPVVPAEVEHAARIVHDGAGVQHVAAEESPHEGAARAVLVRRAPRPAQISLSMSKNVV